MDPKMYQEAQNQAKKLLEGNPHAQQCFTSLQQKLSQAGTIADIFRAWREEVIPPAAHISQVNETERAMYAACNAFINAFFREIDRSGGDGKAAMDWLEARLNETSEYAAGRVNQILMNRQQ